MVLIQLQPFTSFRVLDQKTRPFLGSGPQVSNPGSRLLPLPALRPPSFESVLGPTPFRTPQPTTPLAEFETPPPLTLLPY